MGDESGWVWIIELSFITAGFWGIPLIELTGGLGPMYPQAVPRLILVFIVTILFGTMWMFVTGAALALDEL